jgi:hypothetical protein
MAIIKHKEFQGWLFDFFICIPLYGCQYFSNIPILKDYIVLIRVLILSYLLLLYVFNKFQSKIVVAILIMFCCVLINTYRNGNDIGPVVARYYALISTILLVACRKNNFYRLVLSIFYSSELLVYINYISMILYPDGLYSADHWFIGQKQDFVLVFYIALITALLLWEKNYERKRIVFLGVICCLSLWKILTLGLTICMFLVVFLYVYSKRSGRSIKPLRLFKIYILLESFIIMVVIFLNRFTNLFLVLGRIQASDNLSKADTFMERITMWDAAIDKIIMNPWGIGSLTKDNFGYDFVFEVIHVHNMMIDLALTGGVICLFSFLYINYYVYNALSHIKSIERDILAYSIFGANVLMLTECLYMPFIFCIYMIAMVYIYYHKRCAFH